MHILLALVFGSISLVFAAIAALTVRVLIGLLAKGPQAAQDAYMRGCSVEKWWGGDRGRNRV